MDDTLDDSTCNKAELEEDNLASVVADALDGEDAASSSRLVSLSVFLHLSFNEMLC